MSNNVEPVPPQTPRLWPWILLTAVIAAVVLAILWVSAEVRRVKTFEHMDFRPQKTNQPPS